MAARAVSDQNNTDYFNVVEQISERVDIENICKSQAVAPIVLGLTSVEGLKTLQAFVSSGKKFSEVIVKARNSGKKFIRAMGLIINIPTDSDQSTHMELTKQRIMALCHKILFQSNTCLEFNSPLVGRINFSVDNPLTQIRPHLGAGFQFLSRSVMDVYRKEDYKSGILLFHVGCMALDYIRKTSPSKNPRTGEMIRPDIDPDSFDFSEYVLSNYAGHGEVFIAGCRNLDQSALTVLESHSNEFYEMVENVSISKFGGSVGDRVAKNFSSIAHQMRRALESAQMSN